MQLSYYFFALVVIVGEAFTLPATFGEILVFSYYNFYHLNSFFTWYVIVDYYNILICKNMHMFEFKILKNYFWC